MSNHRAARTRRDRRTAPVVAGILVVAVIGAAATAATLTTPAAPDLAVAPTETAAAPEPQTELGAITDAGYVAQAVGVPVAMPAMDGEGRVLTVNVTDITTGFECTAEGAEGPEHGQYIALTVEARAGDTFGEDLEMYPLSPADFTVLGDDGGQPEDTQGNAATCIPAEDALPPVLTSDGPASGLVVLDAPDDVASVLYVPGGWEWAVPVQG